MKIQMQTIISDARIGDEGKWSGMLKIASSPMPMDMCVCVYLWQQIKRGQPR